jgi:hypothetical protein
VLVNIAREWDPALSPDSLYERTRRYWCCTPKRHRATHAMAVGDGVIREVYRIDSWREVDMAAVQLDPERKDAGKPLPLRTRRQTFEGAVAHEMHHYVGQSVRHLVGRNPIRWLNC